MCATVLLFASGLHASDSLSTGPESHERMALIVDYLSRAQLPSGFFPYDFNFATGASADMSDIDGINLVRQTIAIFALSEYYARYPSEQLKPVLQRALRTLAGHSLPIGRGVLQGLLEKIGAYNRWRLWQSARQPLDDLGLLYQPEGAGSLVSANGTYERAWPGATALALISELNYSAASGDDEFVEMRHRWARGLEALHVQGRGFREAPHYLSESPYVNGEGWLALARYAQRHPNHRIAQDTLPQLEDYVIHHYSDSPISKFFHWGMMAAETRAQYSNDPRLLTFLRDQASWLLTAWPGLFVADENHCWKIEGLASFIISMQKAGLGDEPLVQDAHDRMQDALRNTLPLQILPGRQLTGLTDTGIIPPTKIDEFTGAFLISVQSATTQVDTTGHCLSALSRMDELDVAL